MDQTVALEQILERRVTIITSALATLVYQDQTYLEHGISLDALVSAATAQGIKYSKKKLEGLVNKELSSGSLIKLENGNLALGPANHNGDSSDSFKFEYSADFSNTEMTSPQKMRGKSEERGGESSSNGLSGSTSGNAAVRVSGRRKMATKVYDPSEYYMGRTKRSDNNSTKDPVPEPSQLKYGRPEGSLNRSTIARLRRNMARVAKKVFSPPESNAPSKLKAGRPLGSLNKKTIKKRLIYAGIQKYNLENFPKKALKSNSAPAESNSVPAESNSAPAESNSAPAESNSAPAESNSAPAESNSAPAESNISMTSE